MNSYLFVFGWLLEFLIPAQTRLDPQPVCCCLSPRTHPPPWFPHKPKTKLAMLLAQADEPLQAKTKLTDWPHGAMATEATESGPSDVDKRVLAMCYKKASMIYNRRKSGTSQMNKRGIKNKRRYFCWACYFCWASRHSRCLLYSKVNVVQHVVLWRYMA